MSEALHEKTIHALSELIASRQVSPRELVEACLSRIDAENGRLNALVTVCADEARRDADRLGDEIARGRRRGPLHGIPIAVKDLTDTAGVRTTYGSSLFRNHVPTADAVPVARLRAAGAIVIGKANTHEFACGTTTTNPHYGATHNPWRIGHIPGGSSGGSAAAVAAAMVPLATGSDTGGSIRLPSALCGCVGIKPSHGRVSLRGTFPMAGSCDHIGPIARTARDCAIALTAMSGYDPADPWSRRLPAEDFARDLERSLRGLRVAVAPAFLPTPLARGIGEAVARAETCLRELGVEIVPVELPDATRVLSVGGVVILGETNVEHADRLAAHADAYGDDVRAQLEYASYLTALELARAQQAREQMARSVEEILRTRADAILLPTTAIEAPKIGEDMVVMDDGTAVVAMTALIAFTFLHNLTRLPTVAVPAGLGPGGLPTSVQLTTAFGEDALALAIASQLEELLWPERDRRPA